MPKSLTPVSGIGRPNPKGGLPNSIYTQLSGDGRKAVSNFIFDKDGNVTFEVNFKNHGKNNPSGHGHKMETPGDFSTGHGGNHIPLEQVPKNYLQTPAGIDPSTTIGN